MGNLTEKMCLIPERLLKCLDQVGFINEVKHRISPTVNQFEAYHELEHDMEKYFGKRIYSDYQSFRVIQARHNKRKKLNPSIKP
jgi:hypothetical protein